MKIQEIPASTPSRSTMMSTFPYAIPREGGKEAPPTTRPRHSHSEHPPQPVAQDISGAHFEATAAAVHPFSRSPLAM